MRLCVSRVMKNYSRLLCRSLGNVLRNGGIRITKEQAPLQKLFLTGGLKKNILLTGWTAMRFHFSIILHNARRLKRSSGYMMLPEQEINMIFYRLILWGV